MFSVDNLYHILQQNLLYPLKIDHFIVNQLGSRFDPSSVYENTGIYRIAYPSEKLQLFFWDQEPFNNTLFTKALDTTFQHLMQADPRAMAYSDICNEITELIPRYQWYYFFHGLAALDWFRDTKYYNLKNTKFSKVFITFNRIVTQDRSYRLWLVASLLDKNLDKHGLISCSLQDSYGGSWRDEIFNKESKLTVDQKKLIYKNFSVLDSDLTLDFAQVPGAASAEISVPQIKLFQEAFVHVVTETVFYPEKLHLTEKIFRPIAVSRPFILAASAGNLQYLKRYGFETFDRWWDESYDNEPDQEKRLAAISKVVEKLCDHSISDLKDMHQEMMPVLEHNREHFYSKFKEIVIHEMLDNFVEMLDKFNSDHNKIIYDYKKLDIDYLKRQWSR